MPSKLTEIALVGGSVLIAAMSSMASAPAEVVSMAPHEKTFASPIGGNIMVGSRDETINRIAPLNQVGTTREALVTTTVYGQVDAAAVGRLKVGYHVGCAVTIGTGTLGATPDLIIPIPLPWNNQTDTTTPTTPTTPSLPITPTLPSLPITPTLPSLPITPTLPSVPITLTHPSVPITPTHPSVPITPTHPSVPITPTLPIPPSLPIPPNVSTTPIAPIARNVPNVPNMPTAPNAPNVPITQNVPITPITPNGPNRPNVPNWANWNGHGSNGHGSNGNEISGNEISGNGIGATEISDGGGLDVPILVNPNPVVTLNLNAGEIAEVPLAEKEMIPGTLIQTVVRDFHIKVDSCTGPVTLRQFAYVYAFSPEVDDSGAVFGDPTWL